MLHPYVRDICKKEFFKQEYYIKKINYEQIPRTEEEKLFYLFLKYVRKLLNKSNSNSSIIILQKLFTRLDPFFVVFQHHFLSLLTKKGIDINKIVEKFEEKVFLFFVP